MWQCYAVNLEGASSGINNSSVRGPSFASPVRSGLVDQAQSDNVCYTLVAVYETEATPLPVALPMVPTCYMCMNCAIINKVGTHAGSILTRGESNGS